MFLQIIRYPLTVQTFADYLFVPFRDLTNGKETYGGGRYIDLQKGDTIYTFTDGFADQFGGPKGKKFKYKQLQDMLLAAVDLPLDTQKEQLNTAFEKWKGDLEQVDDVCVIGIRI